MKLRFHHTKVLSWSRSVKGQLRESAASPAAAFRRCIESIDNTDGLHLENYLLALCNMRTLYLRNVPDDVVERLERLAARDATSVGAVAVRELAEVSRRADNPALLGALPDLDVDTATIVADLEAERADR